MAGAGGFQNIVLPREFPSQGEIMDKQIARRQQESQFERELAERREERDYTHQQQNRLYNLKEIDSDTDAAKYKTGQQAIDDYTIGELNKIKNKALSEYINLDPPEMEYRLTQDMNGLLVWHTAAKDTYDKIQKSVQDLNKTYPNIDLQKAQDIAMNNFATDFMENKNGQWQRRDVSTIKQRDYTADLQKPEVLGMITNDTSPFADYIQSFKPQDIAASEYKSNKGYTKKFAFSAKTTPFSEIAYDADGKPSGVKLKSENLDLGGGNTLKMLPQDQYNQMMSIPKVQAAVEGMWSQVRPAIEKEYVERNRQPINRTVEDHLKRAFVLDQIDKNNLDNHYFKTDEASAIPRPQITVNVGDYSNVNDVYKTINSKVEEDNSKGYDVTRINSLNSDAQNIIVDFVKKTTGNNEFNYSNLFLHKNENGDIGIYNVTTKDDGTQLNVANARQLIGFLPKAGTNLKAPQAGAKEKRAIIEQENKPTITKKKISGF